jgi:DNA-binding transcriptional LysR family regulator
VGVPATSGQALAALQDGRCHAALVHGPPGSLQPPAGLRRWHLARWRTGVASHAGLARPSLEALLTDPALVQREPGAASQQALERAAGRLGLARGAGRRTAGGHLDAARAALEHRGAAVAIEPVALALGLDFLELEVHDVELWVPERWTALPGLRAFGDLLTSARLRDRAGVLPGYDLADMGAAR